MLVHFVSFSAIIQKYIPPEQGLKHARSSTPPAPEDHSEVHSTRTRIETRPPKDECTSVWNSEVHSTRTRIETHPCGQAFLNFDGYSEVHSTRTRIETVPL